MRLKDFPEKDGKRVWLSEKEIQQFVDQARNSEQRVAFLLGARHGLRRKEILEVSPADLQETDVGTILRVWHGKGDKYREIPAAPELATIVRTISHDIEPDEPVVDKSSSTVYRWCKRAGERLHSETGDEGWQYVDVHDLRRTWGVRLLEDGVLPSVVFEWGGWESWPTFRDHYLAEFSPEALRRERSKVDYLRETGQRPQEQSGDDYVTVAESASRY